MSIIALLVILPLHARSFRAGPTPTAALECGVARGQEKALTLPCFRNKAGQASPYALQLQTLCTLHWDHKHPLGCNSALPSAPLQVPQQYELVSALAACS